MKNIRILHTTMLFLFIIFLGLISAPCYSQTPCESNPGSPFGLSSSLTVCALDQELTELSFKIFNEGAAGTYEISFPDGEDTLLINIEGNILVTHSFLFDCNNMPGNPISPNSSDQYYRYVNELLITRTDCVDNLGQFSIDHFNFNVVPNPINGFSNSDVDCISSPYLVDFDSDICDVDLVDQYQWYIDGIPIPAPEGNERNLENYSFPDQGTYSVRLEVLDYFNCGPYSFERDITITAEPTIDFSVNIDSSELCSPIVEVLILNGSLNVDSYNWSSTSDDVSFSDPNSSSPIITINNSTAGAYEITLEASNVNCGSVSEYFIIQTFSEQMINLFDIVSVCTQAEINLCDYLEYVPTPDNVVWSSTDPSIIFTDNNQTCPIVEFTESGDFSLTAEGEDICGKLFSLTIPVSVTEAIQVTLDFEGIDTLCETGSTINLLEYVNPSNYIVSCFINGNEIENCQFKPSGYEGSNLVSFVDSCGIETSINIFVLTEGDFHSGDQTVCIGDAINLNTLQEGIYIGDGVINNTFYSDSIGLGTYPIQFQGAGLCGGDGEFNITVIEYPTAGFLITTTSCIEDSFIYNIGETITIENVSSSNVLCYNILETGEELCDNDVNFTFDSSGIYTIQQIVEVGTGGCMDTIRKIIIIEEEYLPTTDITSDTSSCDSVQVDFNISNVIEGYGYLWTFSNNQTSTSTNSNIIIPRPFVESELLIDLQIITFCDTVNNSWNIDLPPRFQASFDILNDNNRICSGETVYFQNTSSNYDSLLFLYDGNEGVDIFPDSLIVVNESDSIRQLEIIVEGFKEGCPSVVYIDTLEVLPVDTKANFSLSWEDENSCSPFTINLQNSSTPGANNIILWGDDSSPQQVGSLVDEIHQYYFENDTTIIITLITEGCGRDTMSKEITVYSSPEIYFEYFPINSQCENDSIYFDISGGLDPGYDIEWDFGDSSSSNLVNPFHSFAEGGNHEVILTVTDMNGCQSTLSQEIEVYNYSGVDLNISVSDIICETGTFDLEIISSENEILIDFGNGLIASEVLSNPYLEEGEYILSFSSFDDKNCSSDTSILVSVVPPIDVSIVPDAIDTTIKFGDNILLDYVLSDPMRNVNLIEWEGENVTYPNLKITNALPENSSYYVLNIIDEFGCEASDSIYVSLTKNYKESIYFPNIFSPNSDGVNDIFYISSKPNTVARIESLKIYSNWGGRVFECLDCFPNNPDHGWDGVFRNKIVSPGVFVWIAEIVFNDNKRLLFKGDVTLLR